MMMVALNLMMNVWMTYKGIFDRKLQGWVFPTIIYMYNFAIIYVYMEGNQMTLTMDILRLFIISIGVGMSLSILNVILGLFANRSYRKGWFTVMTAIMGIVSVLSGYLIFHQLMKL